MILPLYDQESFLWQQETSQGIFRSSFIEQWMGASTRESTLLSIHTGRNLKDFRETFHNTWFS